MYIFAKEATSNDVSHVNDNWVLTLYHYTRAFCRCIIFFNIFTSDEEIQLYKSWQ